MTLGLIDIPMSVESRPSAAPGEELVEIRNDLAAHVFRIGEVEARPRRGQDPAPPQGQLIDHIFIGGIESGEGMADDHELGIFPYPPLDLSSRQMREIREIIGVEHVGVMDPSPDLLAESTLGCPLEQELEADRGHFWDRAIDEAVIGIRERVRMRRFGTLDRLAVFPDVMHSLALRTQSDSPGLDPAMTFLPFPSSSRRFRTISFVDKMSLGITSYGKIYFQLEIKSWLILNKVIIN